MIRTKLNKMRGLDDRYLNKYAIEMHLNDRQKAFCKYYVLDWNITKAYKKAYGVDDNSASAAGKLLLGNIKIQHYIKYIQENIAETIGLSKMQLIKELKHIALSNVSKIYSDWMTQEDFATLKQNNPGILKAIQEISTKTESKLNEYKDIIQVNYVRIKFYDKQKAIDAIFKAMGWNEPDKISIFVEQPIFGGEL
jgi:phage terminase small subunit